MARERMTYTVDQLIAFEAGEMSRDDTLALFQGLVDTGDAWRLQGMYGRTAAMLLREGLIAPAPEAA